MIGAVYNTSSNDVVLTIKGAEGSQTQVPVKKNSYTMLNDSTDAAILTPAGAKPGAVLEVTISENGTNKEAKFTVPVMDGTIVDYKSYLPTPAPTGSGTATSTEAATPTETATPTPSSTAGH